MKTALLMTSICCGLAAGGALAQGADLRLMAGPPGSAPMRAAEDIATVARACGLNLAAAESQGSLQNLLAINDQELTPLAIVQGDFLEYLRTFEPDDPKIAEKIARIGTVATLFSQDVVVVARSGIDSVLALTGRKVAIGGPESGSFLTARVILDLMHVRPAEYVLSEPAEALAALKSGAIDAVFVVDTADSALLAGAGLAPEEFHLLDLNDPVLALAYPQTTIAAGTYEFAPEAVTAVSVPSVLIAFDFEGSATGEDANPGCRAVAGAASILKSRGDDLAASGNQFWSGLDPDQPVPDWTRTSCAEQGFDPGFVLDCTAPEP
jgi:uncharacterized protein